MSAEVVAFGSILRVGHFCPMMFLMTGKDFIRRVRKLSRERGLTFREERSRGKGDHRRIWLETRMTIVPDLGEIKTGTLHAMLKDLGLNLDDMR